MLMCRLPDGRTYPLSSDPRDQALCEDQGGTVQGGGVIGCGVDFLAAAARQQGPPADPSYESFRGIGLLQLQYLRDAYLVKSDMGRELIRINLALEHTVATGIVADKELLAEAMFLLAAACLGANSIVACKLVADRGEGMRVSQEQYDRVVRFAERVRGLSNDPEFQRSIKVGLERLKGLVGLSARQLLGLLEASATAE